jgi:hypothetical protein
MSRSLLLFSVGLIGLFLVGCDDDWDVASGAERYHKDFHHDYALAANGRVEVEGFNGSIEIIGRDANSVEVEATMYADRQARLDELKIDVQPSTNSILIRAIQPMDRHGNAGARFVIHVPRHAELANIHTSNGPIRVDGVDGAAHLRTSNGRVQASGIQGTLDVETSNGSVDVSDITGNAFLRSSNGRIQAEVRKGEFEATTSNGSINVRLRDPADRPVRLRTSNGGIEVELNAARDVRASTSNAPITVRIPPDAGANVSAHASNSSITSDFEVTVHGLLNRHVLEGTIGKGGPMLDLTTTNGRIHLLRL